MTMTTKMAPAFLSYPYSAFCFILLPGLIPLLLNDTDPPMGYVDAVIVMIVIVIVVTVVVLLRLLSVELLPFPYYFKDKAALNLKYFQGCT